MTIKSFWMFVAILICSSLNLQAKSLNDNGDIKGIVIDSEGIPLIGASVNVKGSNVGSLSDVDGNFVLKAKDGQILVVSYLGYRTIEIKATTKEKMTIIMSEDQNILDELVVIGYGTTTKRELTAAVSQIKSDDLNRVVSTNISSALKGKAAGIRVHNASGAPGRQAEITIRGGSSAQKSNSALIIVDGMPSSLANVAPEDVESIEVLKDAASTAIYGSRASNGIILVTTKAGKSGKPIVTARASYGYQNAARKLDRVSTEQYLQMTRSAIARSPFVSLLDQAHPAGGGNTASSVWSTRYLNDGEEIPSGWKSMIDPVRKNKLLIYQDNDLQDQFFEGGSLFNAYASVAGGTDIIQYMTSLSYVKDWGFVPSSNWDNLTARVNLSVKVNNNVKLFTNISVNRSYADRINNETNIFAKGIHLAPTIRNEMEDGTIPGGKDTSIRNPFFITDNIIFNNLIFNFSGKIGLEWSILDGLTAKAEATYSPNYSHREYFEKKNVFNEGRDAQYFGDINQKSQFEAILNYKKLFGEKHKLDAVLGTSTLSYDIYPYSAKARGGSRDDIITLNASTEYIGASSSREKEKLNSFFGRVSYGFNERWNTSVSFRADGSSVLYHKWKVFPGVSTGYVLSEESFMKELDWWSLAKIRLSYGLTGNNNVTGRYAYQGLWSLNSSYDGAPVGTPSSIANNDLKWETTTQYDIGIDLAFLNNRLNLNIDYYNKLTKDLLFSVPLPNTSGFGSIEQNYGEVLFWGLEGNISAKVIDTKDIGLSLGANISYNMNEIKKLPDNGQYKNRIGGASFPDEQTASVGGLAEGERMYSVIGYKVSHILDSPEAAANAIYDERAAGWDPITKTYVKGRKIAGDYEWVDKNGDGKITEKDQFVLGHLVPTTTGGFNVNFRYRNFELYTLWDYALGHVIYDRQISYLMGLNDDGFLIPTKEALDTWRNSGDASKVRHARIDISDGAATGQWNHMRTSNMNTYKGDYLSIREVKLAYNVPSRITNKLKVKTLNIYVSGQNLYYFSEYPGYVTEYSGSGRNISDSNYPLSRIYSIGAQLTF